VRVIVAEHDVEQIAAIDSVIAAAPNEIEDSRLQWRQPNAEPHFGQRLTATCAGSGSHGAAPDMPPMPESMAIMCTASIIVTGSGAVCARFRALDE
jgi:hypothetical protein